MVDSSQIQAYLKGLSGRYKQWRRDNALTDTIANQQEAFTFKQFVQTEERQSGDRFQKEIKTYPLFEGIHHYLLNKFEHILLVGSPGVGKSSALWHFLDTSAKEALKASEPRIPVLLQLKAYRDSFISAEDPHGLLTLIQSSLRPWLRLSLPEIDSLLCDRRLILLLDGLNEIPAGVFRTHLQQFRDECRELQIPLICSTREMGGGDLGIQRKLEIQPLNSGETDRFLQECLPEHQDQVRQLLQRDNRDLSRTPFVLWMLYHLLQETGTIAETLGEAFRQFFRFHCRSYKEDAPVPEERRKAWNSWMEHLAFTMLSSPDPLDPGLVITKEKAENILAERFGELQGNSSRILELEKYYLLAPVSDREISFKHQLIQEYYAAEGLLEKLKEKPHILQNQSEQEYTPFQMYYFNHLKWTETISLMLGLPEIDNCKAIEITNQALEIDLFLGAKIAGSFRKNQQEAAVNLVNQVKCPKFLNLKLLHFTYSVFAVDLLSIYLKNENSLIKERSARALGDIGGTLAIHSLLDALSDPDFTVRWEVVSSLSKIGGQESIEKLMMATEDSAYFVRIAAVSAVAMVGGQLSHSKLIKLLKNTDLDVYLQTAYELANAGHTTGIQALKSALYHSNSKLNLRAVAILASLNSKESKSILLKALQHPKPGIVWRIVEQISSISVEELAQNIVPLENRDPLFQKVVIECLGRSSSHTSIQKLISFLDSDDSNIRINSAQALSKLRVKEATPKLLEMLETEEVEAVPLIIRAIGQLQETSIVPNLLKYLNRNDFDILQATIQVLGELGDGRAVPELFKLQERLEEQSSLFFMLEMEISKAYGKLNSMETIHKLEDWLNYENHFVSLQAASSLLNLCYSEKAVVLLKDNIKNAQPFLIDDLLFALTHIEGVYAVPVLEYALSHGNYRVRKAAVYALSQNQSDSVIPALKFALNDEKVDIELDAAVALARKSSKTAILSLKKYLNHTDIFIRIQTVAALAELACEDVTEELLKALTDKDSNVREQAVLGISKLNNWNVLASLWHLQKQHPNIDEIEFAIRNLQSRCGVYSFLIQQKANKEYEQLLVAGEIGQSLSTELLARIDQSTQEIDKRTLQMSNEPKNDFSGANFYAPVNFGDNPKGDFIRTQNNFHTDAEVQNVVSDLKILLTQLQDQHPSVNTESEALAIIDAEFTEIRTSRNHRLATLQKQLLNPERHLQACKAAAGEVAKHYLEDSVWAKTIITYIDKLSEEPGYGA